jgi:hypothetical protein
MGHELQRLQAKHLLTIDLALAGLGTKEIAEHPQVQMTPQAVSMIMNSPCWQEEFTRRRQRQNAVVEKISAGGVLHAQQMLQEHSTMAAASLTQLATGAESESVRRQAARDVLDLAFVGKNKDGPQVAVMISAERLQILMNVMKQEDPDEVSVVAAG